MPIDYSKFDNIDTDDDSDDDDARTKKTPPTPSSKPAAPSSSAASDASAQHKNFHFDETKLDDWGVKRVRELLHKAVVRDRIAHEDIELDLDVKLVERVIAGECWVHVRKGKKVCGYDFDIKLDWAGKVGDGMPIHGFLETNFTVDDAEPDFVFGVKQEVPFKDAVFDALRVVFVDACDRFVKELSEKGPKMEERQDAGWTGEANVQVGQYVKYEEGPDGVKSLQECARAMSVAEGAEGAEISGEGNKHQRRLHTSAPTH
jgi:activator of HSP90 ATPase